MKEIQVADREDIDRINRRLDEGDQYARKQLYSIGEIIKANTDAVAQIQDDLQNMPGGYRNSQDIKHLKGRIERLEAGKGTAYLESLEKRIADLETSLRKGSEVTVHSRLSDLENIARVMSKAVDDVKAESERQRDDYHMHVKDLRMEVRGYITEPNALADRVKRMEECCKNVVSAGKETEKRLDQMLKDVDWCKDRVGYILSNMGKFIRDTLKSL